MRFAHFTAAVMFLALGVGLPSLVRAESEAPRSEIGEKVPGAERLEGRLLAPCCWAQTLDIHGSEIANSLRREIRTRLKAGEPADAIEQNLVARYGERMRAVPDDVPLSSMGTLGWLGVAASAVFLTYVLRAWRKRSLVAGKPQQGTDRSVVEVSDERLESELRRINDA